MGDFAKYIPEFLTGTQETLYMVLVSAMFAYLVGLPLGVWVTITDRDGLRPNRAINSVLSVIINVGRSVPFIILIVALIPLTRFLVGTSIGPTAAIVALSVAAAPFVARMVETSLKEIDLGMIEAARTMGATDWQIIFRVMLPESVPSLIRGLSITIITLVGYSAMAGAVGGGGLGFIAISYGYNRFKDDVMLVTVILMIAIVSAIQLLFELVAKAVDKKNR
ncbi:MAG: ABC transporter permease [Clostridia bacterium]|nr:ABC transporter permease [Clostridia bacterium]